MEINGRLIQLYWGLPPDPNIERGQMEYAEEKIKKELPPERKPGDKFILFGTATGIIAGIIAAFRFTNPLWLPIACIIAGGLAGTMLGSVVGALVTRRQKARRK
jgi:hypothetical protein